MSKRIKRYTLILLLCALFVISFLSDSVNSSHEKALQHNPERLLEDKGAVYNSTYINQGGTEIDLTLVRHYNFSSEFNHTVHFLQEYGLTRELAHFCDFDGDGKLDLVFGAPIEYEGYQNMFAFFVYLDVGNTPNNTEFNPELSDIVILPPPVGYNISDMNFTWWYPAYYVLNNLMLGVGDINGDGKDDIILSVYRNRSSQFPPQCSSYYFLVDHLTNGTLYIILGSDGYNRVIDLNTPHLYSSVFQIMDLPNSTYFQIDIQEVNGDNYKDIIFGYKPTGENFTRPEIDFIFGREGWHDSSLTEVVNISLVDYVDLPDWLLYEYYYHSFYISGGDMNGNNMRDIAIHWFEDIDVFYSAFPVYGLYDFASLENGIYNISAFANFAIMPDDTFQVSWVEMYDIDMDGKDDLIFNTIHHSGDYYILAKLSKGIPLSGPYNISEMETYKYMSPQACKIYKNSIAIDIDDDNIEELLIDIGLKHFIKPPILFRSHGVQDIGKLTSYKAPNLGFDLDVKCVKTENNVYIYHYKVRDSTYYPDSRTFNRSLGLDIYEVKIPLTTPPEVNTVRVDKETLYRGDRNYLLINVTDDKSPVNCLTPEIQFRVNGTEYWRPYPPTQHSVVDPWTILCTLSTNLDSPVGVYDLRIRAYDSSGLAPAEFFYMPNAFEVLDNP
ncbi:hypothetical protein DRN97_11045, partial [Methanosarcinales archaeon]